MFKLFVQLLHAMVGDVAYDSLYGSITKLIG